MHTRTHTHTHTHTHVLRHVLRHLPQHIFPRLCVPSKFPHSVKKISDDRKTVHKFIPHNNGWNFCSGQCPCSNGSCSQLVSDYSVSWFVLFFYAFVSVKADIQSCIFLKFKHAMIVAMLAFLFPHLSHTHRHRQAHTHTHTHLSLIHI